MRRLRRGQGRGERGQALVEFALVSLVFFLFVFGIMDGARLFESWMAVQHASREGARYAITGRSDCDGAANRTDCIEWVAKTATTGLVGGGADADDADVSVSYTAWDYSGWSGTGTASATGKQCDQIEVTVTYTHHFMTPILQAIAPSGVTIKGQQRMTNEPWGVCINNDGVS